MELHENKEYTISFSPFRFVIFSQKQNTNDVQGKQLFNLSGDFKESYKY